MADGLGIVIPVHNKSELTDNVLKQLVDVLPTTFMEYDVAVVDNGSTDDTEEIVSHYIDNSIYDLHYLKLDKNYGFAHACNQGILEICSSFPSDIILLNNDTLLPIGFHDRLLGIAYKNETAAIVGPRTNRAAGYQRVMLKDEHLWEEFDRILNEKYSGQYEEVRWVTGFCMYIPNSIIKGYVRVPYRSSDCKASAKCC